MGNTKPLVVWAAQSPTLLNILARSEEWDMRVTHFGDVAHMYEYQQLEVPEWNHHEGGVKLAFACTPHHVDNIQRLLPNALIVRVAHQGYAEKIPHAPLPSPIVAFDPECAHLIEQSLACEVNVLVPSYEVKRTWKWEPNRIWSMMSRPKTRDHISSAALLDIQRLSKHPLRIYGQGQIAGPLNADQKKAMREQCSAYVSALPPRAGFGLAEHEAMACGCPVVGAWWGHYLMLSRFGQLREWHEAFTDYGDIYGLTRRADHAAESELFAKTISDLQMDFVRRRLTPAARDESIRMLLTKCARYYK